MKKFDINKTLEKINRDLSSFGAPRLLVAELIPHDPFTFCKVSLGDCIGKGFAKRNPVDKPSRNMGIRLALNRAVSHAIEQYKRSLS